MSTDKKIKVGIFIFYKGSDYYSTARSINEKLNEKAIEHDQAIDAESIISIDYHTGNNVVFYKYYE